MLYCFALHCPALHSPALLSFVLVFRQSVVAKPDSPVLQDLQAQCGQQYLQVKQLQLQVWISTTVAHTGFTALQCQTCSMSSHTTWMPLVRFAKRHLVSAPNMTGQHRREVSSSASTSQTLTMHMIFKVIVSQKHLCEEQA